MFWLGVLRGHCLHLWLFFEGEGPLHHQKLPWDSSHHAAQRQPEANRFIHARKTTRAVCGSKHGPGALCVRPIVSRQTVSSAAARKLPVQPLPWSEYLTVTAVFHTKILFCLLQYENIRFWRVKYGWCVSEPVVPSGYSEISKVSVDKPGRRLYNIRGPMLQEVVSVVLQIDASEGNMVITVRSPLQVWIAIMLKTHCKAKAASFWRCVVCVFR